MITELTFNVNNVDTGNPINKHVDYLILPDEDPNSEAPDYWPEKEIQQKLYDLNINNPWKPKDSIFEFVKCTRLTDEKIVERLNHRFKY